MNPSHKRHVGPARRDVPVTFRSPAQAQQDLAEALPHMIWTATPEGVVDYVSREFMRTTGIDDATSSGEAWLQAVHPDDRERVIGVWSEAAATGNRYEIEFRIRQAASMQYRWYLVAARPHRDADGRILKWYGSTADIHDRKLAEKLLQRSEATLRTVVEAQPECLALVSAGGLLLNVNSAGLRLFEIGDFEEALGRSLPGFIHPDDRQQFFAAHRAVLAGTAAEAVFRLTGLGGTLRWCEAHLAPMERGDGRRAAVALIRDISARRQTEAALADARRRTELILASTAEGIQGLDAGGRIVFVNPSALRILGYAEHEVLGRDAYTLLRHPGPDAAPHGRESCPIQLALRDGETRHVDNDQFRRRDGAVFPVEYTVAALPGEGGVTGVVVSFRNVAAKRRHSELRALEAQVLDMVSAGEALERILEQVALTVDRLLPGARSALMLVERGRLRHCAAPHLPQAYRAAADGLLVAEGVGACGTAASRREQVIVADTRIDPLWAGSRELAAAHGLRACWSTPVVGADGAVLGTLGLYYREPRTPQADEMEFIGRITQYVRVAIERSRHRSQLLAAEERFRSVAQATSDVVWDWNLAANSVWWNDGYRAVLGHAPDEEAGDSRSWLEPIHPEDRDRVLANLRAVVDSGAAAWSDQYRFRRADGAYLRVTNQGLVLRDQTGQAVRIVGSMVDVTEKSLLEEQLRQSQRLDAIGQLTGGVAHDFNNLLTVILGNAELLSESLQGAPSLRKLADITAEAAERGADLANRLLAFARRQPLAPKVTEINRLLAGMDGLLRRALGEHVELQLLPAPELWTALTDPAQLESAILNLCINARDAMPGGGQLAISTGNVHVGVPGAVRVDELASGEYVCVSVSDSGTGMDSATLEKAFEPFFTTKEVGKGSGLGLSMVYGFAKQSNGHVGIASTPGQGTIVTLYLPRAASGQAVEAAAPQALRAERGDERILLVEDNELVRLHATAQLEGLGYLVTPAANGSGALELLAQSGPFDLLFTDVVMPGGMSGAELAQQVRREHPKLPVLFTSGYAQDTLVHDGRLDDGVHLLVKPYRRQDLAVKVREILGEAARLGGR